TLRQALDWSYDLLGAAEQVLLRRLAVFAGGWTLEAAEAICGPAAAQAAAEAVGRPEAGVGIIEGGMAENAMNGAGGAGREGAGGGGRGGWGGGGRVEGVGGGERQGGGEGEREEHREESGTPRFALLETIREYAHERLAASGEVSTIERAHAAYYLALAEEGE